MLVRTQSARSAAALLLLGLLALLVLAALLPARAEAHAFLERSDPGANAVLPEAPVEARLYFTEPLEPGFSAAELYDAAGTLVATDASQIGQDNELILPLPAGLPNGTYTLQWRNVSAADGHPQQGYVPFTVGSQADVVTPAAPEQTDFNPPPRWLDATGRWLSLLGLVGAAGALACWLWVLRPARAPLDAETGERVAARVATSIYAWGAVGLLGSLVALVVQVWTLEDGFALGATPEVLTDTRFGQLWLARVVLMLGLAAAAASPSLWDEPPSPTAVSLALAIAWGAMLPFSLNSHSSAPGEGRTAAIIVDWLHLAAASVWVGGLLALLIALIYGTRAAPGPQRRAAYALAVPRFTTLAIASVIVLTLTGFYASWLHVGNLTALRETDYGLTLVVKLALVAVLLVLGALNMRVIGPRLAAAARAGTHLGRTVAAEVALGIGVLFAVGLLTGLPTARETIESEAGNTVFHLNKADVHAALYIAPGAAGVNRYTVDMAIDGQPSPAAAEVLLRMEPGAGVEVEGLREVAIPYRFGARFEASGSELSVAGDWQLELIVRREGQADVRFQEPLDLPRRPPAERIPGPPPIFTGAAAGGAVILAGLAIAAIVAGLRLSGDPRGRATTAGAGGALLLASALLLLVNYDTEEAASAIANPIPRTPESVAAGRDVFLEACATCHGDEAMGDGPTAASLEREPANLTEQHVEVHTDGDLQWWIANGIPPAMPGFSDDLTDEEIWHVVNYIRSLREPATGTSQ